ncbi:hypothetical protein IL306_001085 [Fusarium sp. DS 682]|nr:hypothetical protein IL306_001085 [Fusarium sp. DS 682]
MADHDLGTVAQLGTNLASKLNLHSEGCRKSSQRLPKLVSLINSTASTLRQLHDLIQQNEKVFTEACMQDLNSLAAKCRVLYVGVLTLIARKTQSISGDKDSKTLSDEQIEKLLACLANMSVWRTEAWNWLEPRFKICRQELKQVKFELVLRYLLGSIARLQMELVKIAPLLVTNANIDVRTMIRSPGAWENENSLRCFAENVSVQRAEYYRQYTKRRAALDKVPSPKSSIDDVRSVYSASTTSTVAPTAPELQPALTPPVKDSLGEESKTEEAKTEEEPANISDEKIIQDNQVVRTSRNWLQRLFSPNTKEDWTNEDIMACVFDMSHGSKLVTRLELDDKELKANLSKLNSSRPWHRRPNLVEQYSSLDQKVRQDIDYAILIAKQWSSRDMTLVAIQAKKSKAQKDVINHYAPDLNVTLYFKLKGAELEPIYLIGDQGRRLEFPYTACATVKVWINSEPCILSRW